MTNTWKDSDFEQYLVSGIVVEAETGRPVVGLLVRAFDRDIAKDDPLGAATTDVEGRFVIRFGPHEFRDFLEMQPDLYLRVFDAAANVEIHSTRGAIRWNAQTVEHYRIQIPVAVLGPLSERGR